MNTNTHECAIVNTPNLQVLRPRPGAGGGHLHQQRPPVPVHCGHGDGEGGLHGRLSQQVAVVDRLVAPVPGMEVPRGAGCGGGWESRGRKRGAFDRTSGRLGRAGVRAFPLQLELARCAEAVHSIATQSAWRTVHLQLRAAYSTLHIMAANHDSSFPPAADHGGGPERRALHAGVHADVAWRGAGGRGGGAHRRGRLQVGARAVAYCIGLVSMHYNGPGCEFCMPSP